MASRPTWQDLGEAAIASAIASLPWAAVAAWSVSGFAFWAAWAGFTALLACPIAAILNSAKNPFDQG